MTANWQNDGYGAWSANGWEVYKNLTGTGLAPHRPGRRGWVARGPNGNPYVLGTKKEAQTFAEERMG